MRTKAFFLLLLLGAATPAFCQVLSANAEASYYAEKFHGRKTASGETFDMNALTCAHKTLPFGTMLRVTNLGNGSSVDVRVNDRGPFVKGREIDLSKAAAQRLGMVRTGTARVKIEILPQGGKPAAVAKSASPADTGTDRWDVQVGSFSSRENANRMAQDLLRNGFEDVYFQSAGTATRVVLRNIPGERLAAVESKLRASGYTDYLVRKNS